MTDREILRGLTRRYLEACAKPDQKRRRDEWRRHNSLQRTQPLIYVRAFAWKEMPESKLLCQDALLRGYEDFFQRHLFWDSLGDDSIYEPWVTVGAVHKCQGWGFEIVRAHSDEPGGAFKIDYAIKRLEDLDKLRMPWHEIDEEATARRVEQVREAIGDLITVNVDRAPAYRMWTADISTELGYLRGIEHFMMDMADNPEWLHRLCGLMSQGVLRTHEQAEAAGDWGLCAHQNQSMPYAQEVPDPQANANGVKRRQLWGYMAAQEFALVSPAQHEEFLLRYQRPVLEQFGLAAYGCCEDLTRKIDMLRQIPNLRRIAVSPFADAARCAEQIGERYVVSYRPSPADMVGYGFDEERIRAILTRDLSACRANGCHVDITLKDVETVGRDPTRVRRWVEVTRRVVEEVFG